MFQRSRGCGRKNYRHELLAALRRYLPRTFFSLHTRWPALDG